MQMSDDEHLDWFGAGDEDTEAEFGETVSDAQSGSWFEEAEPFPTEPGLKPETSERSESALADPAVEGDAEAKGGAGGQGEQRLDPEPDPDPEPEPASDSRETSGQYGDVGSASGEPDRAATSPEPTEDDGGLIAWIRSVLGL